MNDSEFHDVIIRELNSLPPVDLSVYEDIDADASVDTGTTAIDPKDKDWKRYGGVGKVGTIGMTAQGQWRTRPDWPWCTIRDYTSPPFAYKAPPPTAEAPAHNTGHFPHMGLFVAWVGIRLVGGVAQRILLDAKYADRDVFSCTYGHNYMQSGCIFADLMLRPNDTICHDNESHPTDPARVTIAGG